LSVDLPPFSRDFEFAVTLAEDLLFFAAQFRQRSDRTDGAVQARFVVMSHVTGDDAAGIVQRPQRGDADALALDRAMITFDLPLLCG